MTENKRRGSERDYGEHGPRYEVPDKDDDREVGWAPRRIRELDARLKGWMKVAERADQRSSKLEQDLTGTDKAVMTLNDRLSKLERIVGFDWIDEDETFEGISLLEMMDDAVRKLRKMSTATEPRGVVRRLDKLEARLERSAGDGMAQPWEIWAEIQFKQLERRAQIADQATTRAFDRIGDLEERVNGMTPYVELAQRVRDLERTLEDMVAQPKSEPGRVDHNYCFSPPIGQDSEAERPYQQVGAPWAAEELRERGDRNQEMYNRGKEAGVEEVLITVKSAVRGVLTGQMGWAVNAPAVKTVLDAIEAAVR